MRTTGLTYPRIVDVLDDVRDLEREEAADIDDCVLIELTAGKLSLDWIPEDDAA